MRTRRVQRASHPGVILTRRSNNIKLDYYDKTKETDNKQRQRQPDPLIRWPPGLEFVCDSLRFHVIVLPLRLGRVVILHEGLLGGSTLARECIHLRMKVSWLAVI